MLRSMLHRLRSAILGQASEERLRGYGAEIGQGVTFATPLTLNRNDAPLVTIGDHVAFGPEVMLLTHDASMRNRIGFTRMAAVSIGDRCFIGARAVILPGVTIGADCIIGAGSVVAKSIPQQSVAAGSPARVLASTADVEERWRLASAASDLKFGPGWKDGLSEASGRVAFRNAISDGFAWVD